MHPDPVQYRLGANCNGSTKREVAKVFFGCRVGRKSNFWEKGGEESKSFTKGLVESKARCVGSTPIKENVRCTTQVRNSLSKYLLREIFS